MHESAQMLTVDVTSNGARCIVAPRGEIDAASCPILRSALARAFDGDHATVVVDLAGVTFMDSSGVGTLAQAHTTLAGTGRQLVLRGAAGIVERVLTISGFGQAVTIE